MNHRLSREELLKRAAFGAALASIPGFAAACGGSSSSSGSSSGSTQKLADTLRFSNWPLYIDIDPKTKKPGTLAAFSGSFTNSVSGLVTATPPAPVPGR